ncbi:MAG TPA: fibronectin type III domain-containing protein [Solirubrobacterales bacterium]|nr:fibronectin type III domain-containing protein [Solirubrobacterales bacterium]
MRKLTTLLVLAAVTLLLAAPGASAVPPSLGPVSATDIQGVSALLKGVVDPEGLSTTYLFEYGTASDFSGATKTPSRPAGLASDPYPARAAISGLSPDTTYFIRLVATNSSGTTSGTASSFTTTKGFGFLDGTEGFAVKATANGNVPATRAGEHPSRIDFHVGLRQGGEFEDQPGAPFSDGDIRDLRIEMPPGLIVNPSALEKCTLDQFHTPRSSPFETSLSGESCPDKAQVGTVEVKTSRGGGTIRRFGLFNLKPAPGVAAQLGFSPFGVPVVLDGGLRPSSDGSYVLTLEASDIAQSLDLYGIDVSLWGVPWAVSHNGERGNCLNQAEPEFPWAKCSTGSAFIFPPLAYLTLPTACSGPLFFDASADSWQQPASVSAAAINRTAGGAEAPMTCKNLVFEPQPSGLLNDSKASSPSGYNFRLSENLSPLTDPSLLGRPPVKKAVVSLPPGVSVNPSVAAGLATCSPSQYAGESVNSRQGENCPNASKLGDFEVVSPLFEGRFDGSIYLATPHDNPFGTLVGVYLVARLPERGLIVKLAGRIDTDQGTGNLVASFDGLPQIPYTDLDLTFRTGQRAFLVTPPACGPAITTIDTTPWALALSPGQSTVGAFTPFHTTSSTQISSGIGGGPCPQGTPPFNPSVVAGGVNSNVNSYTPYFIHISRQDTEQEITSYSLTLPEGITGKLAGIPFCPDSAIEAARRKSGTAEEQSPSCPAASAVGRVETGYGVGNSLTYTTGKIYLAGPYNNQPLSLVVINPATVGPFDVGVVVIRSAFSVNQRTAQLQIDKSASDRIPHILSGIPLHLRDVRIYMDRFQFIHNPSSCAPGNLISTLTGAGLDFSSEADNSSSSSSRHFQLLNCRTLGFKPKLGIRLKGPTRRGAYPELRATFAARGQGDTNLKEIKVSLPRSEFLAQNHIKGICTKAQFAREECPANSAYGKAVAYTPLFDEPLRGNVYLRSSQTKLPDLVASLRAGEIRIVLEGEIGPTKQGGISAFFRGLPDQPVDRFVMILNGGRRGLLQNSADICKVPPEATVQALGQTNLGDRFTTVLRGQCKGKGKAKAKRQNAKHRRGLR